jgi:hypothetical protein
MPASITIFLAIVTALWLAGVAACCVALALSGNCRVSRFPAAVGLCAAALVIGYAGFARFELTYARTVNGQGWSISSKWFFLALMVIAAVSLLVVCSKRLSLSRNSQPNSPSGDPPSGDSAVASSS